MTDPMLGRRLREALHVRELSIRQFHRDAQALGVPGSSYPAIHRYLSGEGTPSLEFLLGTADLLGIRAAWLAFGEGEMTEDAGAEADSPSRGSAMDRAAALDQLPLTTAFFFAAVSRDFPQLQAAGDVAMLALGAAYGAHLHAAQIDRRWGGREMSESELAAQYGTIIGGMLQDGLGRLARTPDDLWPQDLAAYVTQFSAAVATVAQGRSYTARQLEAMQRKWASLASAAAGS